MYDKDFRIHMAKFPTRSWSIILQQAWNLRLREKIRYDRSNEANRQSGGHAGNQSGNNFNPQGFCKWFNKGRCSYGKGCIFEYRCYFCGKYGHRVVNCRLLKSSHGEGRYQDSYDIDRYDRRDPHYHHDRKGDHKCKPGHHHKDYNKDKK